MSNVAAVLETFSEREVEILRLLDEGLSDREIADKLILALSTVKWYNQQIYSKLGVSKRGLAITRARQLGLLNGAVTSPTVATPPSSNLPVQPTRFVGRKRETAEVKHLLQSTRLLTLTGSPGTGKTRLALQVASEVQFDFKDGVYFVPLAALPDAALFVNNIIAVLGLETPGNQSFIESLKTDLQDKQMLLLLDNFEHMLANAPILSQLLASAPGLKCLVTSREVLHLYGEQEYFVPTLSLPDPEAHTDFTKYEAVELFLQQARAVKPDFKLTDENALDVAKICIRLDGLPLAIELAAARIKMFSPHDLLTRMGSVIDSFASSRRDIAARHQTLGHTLNWSYDLLDETEKTVFAQLSVFAGGWTLDAAEFVCGDNPTVNVLDTLASLVDKSLVRQENTDNEIRFSMLRIIREYAAQRLEESGMGEAVRQRHANYYITFVERASDINFVMWLNRLETDHDNFRAVLRWSLDGDPEPGLRLIHVLGMCWRVRGHMLEGYHWAQSLLEKAQGRMPVARSKALSSTSSLLACILGNHDEAERMAVEALALADGDRSARAAACFALGNALAVHDLPAARAHLEESLELFKAAEDRWGSARALNCLGEVVRVQEDYAQATTLYEDALKLFREIDHPWGENIVLHNLAHIALHRGDFAGARSLLEQVITVSVKLNDKCSTANALVAMAEVMSAVKQPERAACLFGAAENLLEMINAFIQPGDLPDYERSVAATQEQLDETTFQSAWAEGREMSLEESLDFALHESFANEAL